MSYIIAIDEGTTSTRAMLYDTDKKAFVDHESRKLHQFYPKAGWVEEDASEIYANTVAALLDLSGRVEVKDVLSIAITNQRETVIMWDRLTGRPVYNAIVWQCRRTADYCKEIPAEFVEKIRDKTGLVVDAYFSATKIKWLLNNVPEAKELMENGRLCAGTVDSYLIFKLTGEFATDYTNASRTMLFNIKTLGWDKELLDYFGIPESILPTVKSSTDIYGYTEILGKKIPVAGVAGDQQASLFGQNCTSPGEAKITYGTGMFLLFNTGDTVCKSKTKMITTIGYSVKDKIVYALEGSVFNAGSAIKWARDNLKLFDRSAASERMALSVPDNGGVYVIPAFSGLGAPYWKADATGIITGITGGTNSDHIVRAILESMAYAAKDLCKNMEADSGYDLAVIRADGGASANDFLMQFQSDVLNVAIDRPLERESTALGAVYLSAIAINAMSEEEADSLRKTEKLFVPSEDREKFENYYKGYLKAIERCLL